MPISDARFRIVRGLPRNVEDLLSNAVAGQSNGVKYGFSPRLVESGEQDVLRRHSFGIECLCLGCGLINDAVALRRKGNLIEVLVGIALRTKLLQRGSCTEDVQAERLQRRDDPTIAIASTGPKDTEQQVLHANRVVVKNPPRLILCKSEHTLRIVVVQT